MWTEGRLLAGRGTGSSVGLVPGKMPDNEEGLPGETEVTDSQAESAAKLRKPGGRHI